MFALLFALVTLRPASAGEVIDRVVAVVGDQLVLDSDVRLEGELCWLDDSALPFWEPGHEDPLHRLIDATIVRATAGDVTLYAPSDAEVRERLEVLRQQFVDRAAWEDFQARWGLDESSLAALLRRRMVVERFLARNLQVSQDEREDWLTAVEALLDQLRPRYPVRLIPQRGAP